MAQGNEVDDPLNGIGAFSCGTTLSILMADEQRVCRTAMPGSLHGVGLYKISNAPEKGGGGRA